MHSFCCSLLICGHFIWSTVSSTWTWWTTGTSSVTSAWAGRCHDASVYRRSPLPHLLEQNQVAVPKDLAGTEIPPLILCDQAFPLTRNLMKPFPHSHLQGKGDFNYALSKECSGECVWPSKGLLPRCPQEDENENWPCQHCCQSVLHSTHLQDAQQRGGQAVGRGSQENRRGGFIWIRPTLSGQVLNIICKKYMSNPNLCDEQNCLSKKYVVQGEKNTKPCLVECLKIAIQFLLKFYGLRKIFSSHLGHNNFYTINKQCELLLEVNCLLPFLFIFT